VRLGTREIHLTISCELAEWRAIALVDGPDRGTPDVCDDQSSDSVTLCLDGDGDRV
jgi:hypothetical protein